MAVGTWIWSMTLGLVVVASVTVMIKNEQDLTELGRADATLRIPHSRVKRDTNPNQTKARRPRSKSMRMVVNDTASYGCNNGSTSDPVFTQEARISSSTKDQFRENNGKIIPRRNRKRLYLVYGQVLFWKAQHDTGYDVTVNGATVYKCSTSSHNLLGSRRQDGSIGEYSQCNVNGLLLLDKGDEVGLELTGPRTQVVCAKHLTFWGLTMVGSQK